VNATAKRKRPQIFVLTPEEKRTLSFVLVALILGLGAKHYRQRHSIPPANTAVVEAAKNAGSPAEKRAEAKRRKAAK
jgi:hypothetical protein